MLPGRGHRPGIAGQHRDVEPPDVDAELERVRRHHAQHVAGAKAALHLAAAVRQVTAAVATDDVREGGRPLDRGLEIGEDDLFGQAASREDDRRHAGAEERRRETARLLQVRAPDPELGVDDGRVVEDDHLLAGGRAVLRDQPHGRPDETLRQLLGVGDRGRGADELRACSVVPTDALEPPEHVREVAPEDPAVRVELVDDDVAEVLEQPDPLRVVRQDPRVEHVGIREHHVGPGPDRAPRVLRRVPVVRVDPERRQGARQLLELRQLILREGLRGEEIEGPRRGLAQEGLQDRQVVAERLAGGGRRHHDAVAALAEEVESPGLVRVEGLDPARPERVGEIRIDRVGNRDRLGRPSREPAKSRHGPSRFGDQAVDQVGEVDARFPGPRHLGVILGVARECCQRSRIAVE